MSSNEHWLQGGEERKQPSYVTQWRRTGSTKPNKIHTAFSESKFLLWASQNNQINILTNHMLINDQLWKDHIQLKKGRKSSGDGWWKPKSTTVLKVQWASSPVWSNPEGSKRNFFKKMKQIERLMYLKELRRYLHKPQFGDELVVST